MRRLVTVAWFAAACGAAVPPVPGKGGPAWHELTSPHFVVWTDADGKRVGGTTAWSIESEKSDHFAPSSAQFMVNYRVEDLHALLKALKDEGCNVLDETMDDADYGKFGWVIDPEGNKVELWQPPAGQ